MITRPAAARRPASLRSNRLAVLLVLPAIVVLIAFTLAPTVYALVLSVLQKRVSGGLFGGGTREVFVGLDNYAAALGDPEFWASIGRMLLVALIGVPATVILAAVFALCLDAK